MRLAHRQAVIFLILVLSHTKIIIRAQEALLRNQTAEDETAAALARAFAGISLNLGTLNKNATHQNSTTGSANATTSTFDINDMPTFARLLNTTLPPGMDLTDAIRMAVQQQQAAGGDIGKPMEKAAKTVAAFLDLPVTLGTGANIKAFVEQVKQFQDLKDSVRKFLNIDQIQQIEGYLNTAAMLGLSWLAAFPLAQLSFLIANIALGAAVTSLLAGIFYLVGSSLAVAAAIPGVAAAQENNNNNNDNNNGNNNDNGADSGGGPDGNFRNSSTTRPEYTWYQNIKLKSIPVLEPVFRFAFSGSAYDAMHIADSVLSLSQAGIGAMHDVQML